MGLGKILNIATISAILALPISGCDDKNADKDSKIRTAQGNAIQLGHEYKKGKGFSYSFTVDGKPIELNLSRSYFEQKKNLIKYTTGTTSVRVYSGGGLAVYSSDDTLVDDPEAVEKARGLTEKVLDELLKCQKKKENEDRVKAKKDLSFSAESLIQAEVGSTRQAR